MESNSRRYFYRIINVYTLLFLTLFLGYTVGFPTILMKSSDLPCSILWGKAFLENGNFPSPALFTFVDLFGSKINPTWLSDVFLSYFYNLGGYFLLVIITSFLIGLLFTFLLYWMNSQSRYHILHCIVLIPGMIGLTYYLHIGNRIFSFILITLLFYMLEKANKFGLEKTIYLSIFLIFLLWANLHPDFFIGLAVLSVFVLVKLFESFLTRTITKKLLVKYGFFLLLAWGSTLFTPYGFDLWHHIFTYYFSVYATFDRNLASPDFHQPYPYRYLELIILLSLFCAALSTIKLETYKLIIAAMLLVLGLYSAYYLPFFIVAILPVISQTLPSIELVSKLPSSLQSSQFFSPKKSGLGWSLLIFMSTLLLFLAFNPVNNAELAYNKALFPVDAVKYANNKGFCGKQMYNALEWGCFIRYSAGCKVFTTERLAMNNLQILHDYINIRNIEPSYADILKKYDISWVLIPYDSYLSTALMMNEAWYLDYKDAVSAIYVRKQ